MNNLWCWLFACGNDGIPAFPPPGNSAPVVSHGCVASPELPTVWLVLIGVVGACIVAWLLRNHFPKSKNTKSDLTIPTLVAREFSQLGQVLAWPRTSEVVLQGHNPMSSSPVKQILIKPGSVAPGDFSPEAPAEPDARIFSIRLFSRRLRYVMVEGRMRGGGSG